MKAKKYKVMLPEDVRGSTANVLHVIRMMMNTFMLEWEATHVRCMASKYVQHDLFQAMDSRDCSLR